MNGRWYQVWILGMLVLALGCSGGTPQLPVDKVSVQPGSSVSRGDTQFALLGDPIAVGKTLPSVALVDAMTMTDVDLSAQKGSVLLVSVVPSIDTKVCEAQTHYLGEQGDRLPKEIRRITISRDTPFAQKRFAAEAKLTDIQYLSDYKRGDFGRATGLLIDNLMLLARSMLVIDREGIVRYLQVVPEITHLPDMEKAFQEAEKLVKAS